MLLDCEQFYKMNKVLIYLKFMQHLTLQNVQNDISIIHWSKTQSVNIQKVAETFGESALWVIYSEYVYHKLQHLNYMNHNHDQRVLHYLNHRQM